MSSESQSQAEERKPGWLGGFRGMLLQQIVSILTIIWINGVTLRMSVRDSADLLAPLYYATPWPVLAVLTLVLLRYVWRQPMAVFAVLFIAHIFLGTWIMENWRPPRQSRELADLRVLQWNVASPWHFQEAIMDRVKRYDADVVAISEPLPTSRTGERTARTDDAALRWRNTFPEHACETLDTGLLLMVRGKVNDRRVGILNPGSPYALYDVRVRDRDLRVLQVDIDSKPVHSRRPPLSALTTLVESLSDRPLIVIGDFNTPRESVHLEPLSKKIQHAWATAGTGCAETWPSYLPVLSLDQVWTGYGLRAVRCSHGVTFRSDHRPVFAELKFD